jgi:hypothetical protein
MLDLACCLLLVIARFLSGKLKEKSLQEFSTKSIPFRSTAVWCFLASIPMFFVSIVTKLMCTLPDHLKVSVPVVAGAFSFITLSLMTMILYLWDRELTKMIFTLLFFGPLLLLCYGASEFCNRCCAFGCCNTPRALPAEGKTIERPGGSQSQLQTHQPVSVTEDRLPAILI